jgi:hypothetical protein
MTVLILKADKIYRKFGTDLDRDDRDENICKDCIVIEIPISCLKIM